MLEEGLLPLEKIEYRTSPVVLVSMPQIPNFTKIQKIFF